IFDGLRRRPLEEAVPPRLDPERARGLNPDGTAPTRVEAGTFVPAPGPAESPGSALGVNRLLGGPIVTAGAERLADHTARLGPLPRHGSALIPILETTGLQGRGGAGFPVGRKWRTVAERPGGGAVVVANGAEGK